MYTVSTDLNKSITNIQGIVMINMIAKAKSITWGILEFLSILSISMTFSSIVAVLAVLYVAQ